MATLKLKKTKKSRQKIYRDFEFTELLLEL